jgi:hypothetical protein
MEMVGIEQVLFWEMFSGIAQNNFGEKHDKAKFSAYGG